MRPSHLRSLSQPPFLSLDSLPPLSPSAADVSMAEVSSHSQGRLLSPSSLPKGNQFLSSLSLPPSKGHRFSNRDIPLGFSDMIQSSPQLIPISGNGVLGQDNLVKDDLVRAVKRELQSDGDCAKHGEGKGERKSDVEVVDDLLNSYVNLDKIDTLNATGIEDKDMDSRASGTKTNGADSDDEVESRRRKNPINLNGITVNFPTEKRAGVKMSAGGDGPLAARHFRSVSMDSLMRNMNFVDESPKLPPSLGAQVGQNSPCNLEYGNGEFSGAELKKIMANEKLAEIAMSDPKRAKRILANRQSAALSKERKVRYIAELEQKVQTLQTETTTLSAQLTLLQRDSAGLTSQNNELKFRVQAMEQQAQLKDALNEALTAEVQHLKLTTTNLRGETKPYSNMMSQKNSMNYQMFSSQH